MGAGAEGDIMLKDHCMPNSARVLRRFALTAVGGALATCALAGCYERVVSAKGFGADQYNVAEPYQESGKLDEWVFGTPGPGQKAPKSKLPQRSR